MTTMTHLTIPLNRGVRQPSEQNQTQRQRIGLQRIRILNLHTTPTCFKPFLWRQSMPVRNLRSLRVLSVMGILRQLSNWQWAN